MTRLSRSRAAVATGSALATVTAGLLLGASPATAAPATAAPAPLPAPIVFPSVVVRGQEFTVTVTGCSQDDPAAPPAGAWIVSTDEPAIGDGAQVHEDGSYTFTERFSSTDPLGRYTLQATCDRYHDDQAYPPVRVVLAAATPPVQDRGPAEVRTGRPIRM
ncbi:hypothetical protein [Modestobacter sp. URMC 112]